MSQIKSIFGAYADKLQVMVDRSLDKFSPTFFQNYFDWGTPSTSLTFVTAIGRARVEAAASIVNRDSSSPLRSRAALDRLNGEIPAIKEKFKMSESDYRAFLTLQSMPIAEATKKQQLLDLLFGDTKRVGDAAMKRVDMMVLEGLSTGQITVTTTNNPDGIVAPAAIDLLMPAGNKKNAAATWATAGSATPVTDIQTVVEDASGRGISFSKILMTRATWLKFAKATEVVNYMTAWASAAKGTYVVTLAKANEMLAANLWPTIEIVDYKVGVEKDGAITTYEPFNGDYVAFIPNGKLGIIHNAVAIEELNPVKQVNYAKFNNALISKWAQNDPFAEWTGVELNAFPGFDAIDSIYRLKVIL
jgi:hypothetical protein